MFSEIYIENFQGFGDGVAIPLAPLTLIFGPNSSGKSSILRSIRLAQQSLAAQDRDREPRFLSTGSAVDIGSFQTAVHRHDVDKVMRLGFEVRNSPDSDPSSLLFSITKNMQINEMTYQGRIASRRGEDIRLCFKKMNVEDSAGNESAVQYELDEESQAAIEKLDRSSFEWFSGLQKRRGKPEDIQDEALFDATKKMPWHFSNWIPKRETLKLRRQGEESPLRDPNALGILLGSENSIDTSIGEVLSEFKKSRLPYVGPLRTIPERITIESGIRESGLADGSDVAEALASNTSNRDLVSNWLYEVTQERYRLAYLPISSDAMAIFGVAGALALHDIGSDSFVAFADVGTGLSQVLPILEKLVTADKALGAVKASPLAAKRLKMRIRGGQTLLIEQPELHLHPKMQADLMTLFTRHVVESLGHNQIIAETHSEAMILRLQSEISAGKVPADLVSILYVDKDGASGMTKVSRLDIGDDGEFISPWPESFSDLRIREISG